MFTCHSVPASIQVSCFEMQIENRRVESMLCVANQFSITIIRFRANGFYDADAGVTDDMLSIRYSIESCLQRALHIFIIPIESIIVFVMCVN